MIKLLFILSVFCFTAINGQNVLTVTSGATISGGVLTLENMDFINEGYSTPVNIRFSGNANSTISGAGGPDGIYYHGFDIAKTGGAKLILLQNPHVHQQVIFTSGYLDLNGHVLCLFTSGQVYGETNSSRIIGSTGGFLQYKQHPQTYSYSPGHTAGVLVSSQNVGPIWVNRGHVSYTGNLGNGTGIQRWFRISESQPASPSPVVTVRLNYFDAEINGFNENDLVFWKSSDLINWTNEGSTSRSLTDNWVELSNITNFHEKYFTLSSGFPARPITSAPQQIKTIAVPGKETITNKWKTWPNPADKILCIDITSTSASPATTSVFDSKGSLIRTQTDHLIEGINRLKMDLKNLAPGIYYVTTNWDAGKEKRSSSFVKL